MSSQETPPFPLAPGWSFARDLALLVGTGLDDAARWLVARGQERALLLLPEDAPQPELGERVRVVRSRGELLQAILHYPPPLPLHVVLRTGPDPWLAPKDLSALAARVKECLHAKKLLHHTVEATGKRSLVQGLENLPHLAQHPSIACLDGAFAGKACVIVSPGPSLSSNLRLLPELRGKALIATGTHALGAFRSIGLAPDLVLAADPGDLARHCAGFDLSAVQAFVAAATTRPDNFEHPAPRTYSFAGNAELDDWLYEPLGENARLPTGGSVACSAFSLAVRLGCDPIVLVGQDLSYSDGRFYAAENLDGDARVERGANGDFRVLKTDTSDGDLVFMKSRRRVEVAGYHGGTVETCDAFRAFLFWFEAAVEARNADGGRVWNCTEGGARIEGAEQLPLATALERLTDERVDVAAVLERCAPLSSPSERAERLARHFRGTLRELDACTRLARRCKQAASSASRDRRALKEFETLERRLRDAVRPLRCIPIVAQAEITAALEEARAAGDLAANLRSSIRLFDVFREAAEYVRGPIEGALEKL